MKQKVLKEYSTPDCICIEDLGFSKNWHRGCYPFINTSEGIVYGDEGMKHNELTNYVIAQLVGCSVQEVKDVENDNYHYMLEGYDDGYSLDELSYKIHDLQEYGKCLSIKVIYQDKTSDYLDDLDIDEDEIREALGNDLNIHSKVVDEIVPRILNQEYDEIMDDGHYVLNVNEELEPYFAIDDQEVDEDLLDNILYYVDGDGKYEIVDYTSEYGRVWPNVGDDDESYISLWLNQRLDWDLEMDNGKVYDGDESGTFDVRNANDDSCDEGNHVPSSLSKSTLKTCIEVFQHFNCDLENSFIAIGDTVLPILQLYYGDKSIQISSDDVDKFNQERAIHLLPPEEKKNTPQIQGFLADRNRKWNKKLMMHDLDGNEKGVMPMAQYNFYKRYGLGDSKMIKGNIIKENMETYNEFILEWKKWILKEAESLEAGNTEEAEKYHSLADEAYSRYKDDTRMSYEFESKTFGELKNIFENNLVNLFKNKSSIIKEYTNLIKEDKNLMAQHHFFTALQNVKEGCDVKEYINEALDLVEKNINYKTIKESNQKVNNLLKKYRHSLNKELDESIVKLCESCDYVLTHKKKISNLNEMNKHMGIITNYTSSHLNSNINESVNTTKLIEDFEKKCDSLLNEEEKTFVQEIMSAKKASDNLKQKKLFEKFKGDCLNQINKMISEASENEKEQLLNIKEQLLNKEFCAETLIKDMAKLLEMRDVLMS